LPSGGPVVPPLPGYRPATSWVHCTTTCNRQSSAPGDGQNNCPKHVELIGIINKLLLLHPVGCLCYLFLYLYLEEHPICQFSVLYCVFKHSNIICLDQQYTHIPRIQLLTMANACRVVQALPNFTLLN